MWKFICSANWNVFVLTHPLSHLKEVIFREINWREDFKSNLFLISPFASTLIWRTKKLKQDYRLWNGTLPALTLCYHNRFDEAKAEALIKRFWNIEPTDKEFSYFLKYTQLIVNISVSTLSDFNQFANDKRLESVDMFFIARDIHPDTNFAASSYDPNFSPKSDNLLNFLYVTFTNISPFI